VNHKKRFGFLFSVFCFLSLTQLTGAQSSSIAGTVTDQQWFQFMAVNAFDLPGLEIKMPLLVGELNLNADEQQEIENLFSDHSDEDPLSQMDAPGQRSSAAATEENMDQDPVQILQQVRLVRRLLGGRDLDFRFWFYEETLIDSGEDSAYRENQNYSADELADNLLRSIEQTQEFEDFKNRKILYFHSADRVINYLTDWEASFERRVLLQVHQVMRRGSGYI
jgi:hypothetical protein